MSDYEAEEDEDDDYYDPMNESYDDCLDDVYEYDEDDDIYDDIDDEFNEEEEE